MISGPYSLSSERDEAIFTQTVGSVLRDTGKGFVVWVKDNQISVEPKDFLQMILSRPTSSLNTQPQRSFAGDFSTPTNAANVSAARKVQSSPGDHIAGDFSPPTNAANVSAASKVQSPPGDHMTSHPLLETHDVLWVRNKPLTSYIKLCQSKHLIHSAAENTFPLWEGSSC